MIDKLNEDRGSKIGVVSSIDTGLVKVKIDQEELLSRVRINDFFLFQGNGDNETLVGMVSKIIKKSIMEDEDVSSDNIAHVFLVGTYYEKFEEKEKIFKRFVSTYPQINGESFHAGAQQIESIMNSFSKSNVDNPLVIGRYALNERVDVEINGNKFFQRHSAIVGSTGSGKSWTVANIIENVDKLNNSNVILFDLHGEYNELSYAKHIKIGNGEKDLKMPLWFFNYDEIHSMFIESSEGTSSNQRAAVIKHILGKKSDVSSLFGLTKNEISVDTPIPFKTKELKDKLELLNVEEIDTGEIYKSGEKKGQPKTRQGNYYNKLTNLLKRLESKMNDSKFNFIFDDVDDSDYLKFFVDEVLDYRSKSIKVIDFSEVPSDVLPIVIGTLARMLYNVQFWLTPIGGKNRHPFTFICDEAHIYMPKSNTLNALSKKSLEIFETIAKEGRKYGVSLLICTQRPSELNTTIFSQCSNILSMKLSNQNDKSSVSSMLNDSLQGLIDMLPNLDIGECIVVGDSVLLPARIKLNKPNEKPKSATIDFWDSWSDDSRSVFNIENSIHNMRKQYRDKKEN